MQIIGLKRLLTASSNISSSGQELFKVEDGGIKEMMLFKKLLLLL